MKSLQKSGNEGVRQSVVSLVYDQIADRIASGEVGANEHLTEAQLVKELQVSRGAVREAMSRLASEGLIRIELNKGAVVRTISRKDMADFLQVRAIYESFAAQRAAERIDEPGAREAIHDLIEECEALAANPTSEGMIGVDTSFHSAVMDLSGNGIMAAEWRRLRRSNYRISFLRSLTPDEVIVSARQHLDILLCILDGAARRAGELSGDHVRLTNNRIQRLTNTQFDAIFNPAGRVDKSENSALPVSPSKTKAKLSSG